MSGGIHIVGLVAVAAITGVGGVAHLGAGGSGDSSLIAVAIGVGVTVLNLAALAGPLLQTSGLAAGLGDGLPFAEAVALGLNVIADIALAALAGVGGVAVGGAGGLRHHGLIAVAGGIDVGIHIALAADGTGVGGVAHLGAGGSGNDGRIAVALSFDQVGHIGVAADGAGIGGIAVLGAGGLGDDGLILVALSLHFLGVAVAALGAGVGGVAILGTGDVSGIGDLVIMAADLIGDLGGDGLAGDGLIIALHSLGGDGGADIRLGVGEADSGQDGACLNLLGRGECEGDLAVLSVHADGVAAQGGGAALVGQLAGIVGNDQLAVGQISGLGELQLHAGLGDAALGSVGDQGVPNSHGLDQDCIGAADGRSGGQLADILGQLDDAGALGSGAGNEGSLIRGDVNCNGVRLQGGSNSLQGSGLGILGLGSGVAGGNVESASDVVEDHAGGSVGRTLGDIFVADGACAGGGIDGVHVDLVFTGASPGAAAAEHVQDILIAVPDQLGSGCGGAGTDIAGGGVVHRIQCGDGTGDSTVLGGGLHHIIHSPLVQVLVLHTHTGVGHAVEVAIVIDGHASEGDVIGGGLVGEAGNGDGVVQRQGVGSNVILVDTVGIVGIVQQIDIAVLGVVCHIGDIVIAAVVAVGDDRIPCGKLRGVVQIAQRCAVQVAVLGSEIDSTVNIHRCGDLLGEGRGGVGVGAAEVGAGGVVPHGGGIDGHPAGGNAQGLLSQRQTGGIVGPADDLAGRIGTLVIGHRIIGGNGQLDGLTGNDEQASGVGIHQAGDAGLGILIPLGDVIGAGSSLTGGGVQGVQDGGGVLTGVAGGGCGAVAHDVQDVIVMIPGHVAGCLADDAGIAVILAGIDGLEAADGPADHAVQGDLRHIVQSPGVQILVLCCVTAVVDGVEGAVIVDGKGVGIEVGCGGGVGTGNGNAEICSQGVGADIVAEEDAVGSQDVQIAVLIVQGHVVDGGHVVAPAQQLGCVGQIGDGSGIQVAVGVGEDGVAFDILRGQDITGILRIMSDIQVGGAGVGIAGGAVGVEPQGLGLDHHPAGLHALGLFHIGQTIGVVGGPGEHLACGIQELLLIRGGDVDGRQVRHAVQGADLGCGDAAGIAAGIVGGQIDEVQLGVLIAGVGDQQALGAAIVDEQHGGLTHVAQDLAHIGDGLVELLSVADRAAADLGIDDHVVQIAVILQNEVLVSHIPGGAGGHVNHLSGQCDGGGTTLGGDQIEAGQGAGGVVAHQNDHAGVGQVDNHVTGIDQLVVVAGGDAVGLQQRCGSAVHKDVGGGVLGAPAAGIAVLRVELPDIAAGSIVAVGAVDHAVVPGTGGDGVGSVAELGDRHVAGVHLSPVGVAVLVGDLSVEGDAGCGQGGGVDGDGGGDRIALSVHGHGGGGDGGSTDAHGGHGAVCVNGGHGLVGGAPGQLAAAAHGQNSGLDGVGLIHVQVQLGDVGADGQIGGTVPHVQAVDQLDVLAEGADQGADAVGGVDGVQIGLLACQGLGQQDVAGGCIIEGGAVGAAAHGGDAGHIDAGHVGEVGSGHAGGEAVALGLGEDGELADLAGLTDHIVDVAGLQIIAVEAGVADGGKGICGEGLVAGQVEVAQGSVLGGDQLDIHTAVGQADQDIEQISLFRTIVRSGGGVGPLPGGGQDAQVGDLLGLGIHGVHLLAVVVVDLTLMEAAGQEGGRCIADVVDDGQVIGGEFRHMGHAIGAGDGSGQGGGGIVDDCDVKGILDMGLGHGGGGDGHIADLAEGGEAVGVDGGDTGIGGRPGDALVAQVPGTHIGGELHGGTHQNLGSGSSDLNGGGLVAGQQHAVAAGNDEGTIDIVVEHAGGTALDALGNVVIDDGGLTGGHIDGVQNGLGAAGDVGGIVAHHVKDLIVVIPEHLVGVVAADHVGVAGSGIEDGSQPLDADGGRAVLILIGLDVIQREGIQVEILGSIALVQHIEGAVLVNGKVMGPVIACGGSGRVGQRNGKGILQLAAVQIEPVEVLLIVQQVHIAVCIVQPQVMNRAAALGGDGVGPVAHPGDGCHVIQGAGIDVAILQGENNIALDIVSSQQIVSGNAGAISHNVAVVGFGKVLGTGEGVVGGVEPQGLGIDLHPAVEAQTCVLLLLGAAVGVAGPDEHLAGVVHILGGTADLVGGTVAGIVGHGDQILLAGVGIAQVHSDGDLFALLGLLRVNGGIDGVAGQVGDLDSGQVVLVLGGDGELIAQQAHADVGDHGSGVIHHHGGGQISAIAQCIGLDQGLDILGGQNAVLVQIVLGDGHNADADALALGKAQLFNGLVDAHGGAVVAPCCTGGVVVGAVDIGGGVGDIDHLAGLIGHIGGQGCGIADQGDLVALQGGAVADGDPVSRIAFLGEVGVADHVVAAGIVGKLHDQGVGIGDAGAGGCGIEVGGSGVAVQTLGIGTLLIHGGVGPAAVEAQHGDGVGHIVQDALGAGGGLHEDVALDVGAVDIRCIQSVLDAVGQADLHGDIDHAACGHGELAGVHGGQDQVGVIGVDAVVLVDVGNGVDGVQLADGVVQDDLGVVSVGVAVLVQVTCSLCGGDILHAVDQIGGSGGHGSGPGIQIADAVGGSDILGEEVGGQGVGLLGIADVVQAEGEGVLARTLGIVTQLSLDLAIGPGVGGVGVHPDVGIGGDGCAHVGQAGALVQDGVVVAAAGLLLHGNCSGHQQALGQLAHRQAGLGLQALIPDVLGHHSGHTGDLRSGHGGTGVVLIGLAGGIHTIDGVDVSAGGGDLGLQDQGRGNAPGAEGAHQVVLAAACGSADLVVNVHLTGVVEHVASLVGDGRGQGLDQCALLLGDGDTGGGLGVVRQVHIDGTCLVVVDDGGDGTGLNGGDALLEEGSGATGADGNLAHQSIAHSSPVLLGADAIDEDVSMLTGDGGHGLVGPLILGVGVVVDLAVAHLDIVAGLAGVLHGGNAQGVDEGSGAAAGVEVHIIGIGQTGRALAVLGPGAVVACGHGCHGAAGSQRIQNLLVAGGGDEAMGGGAQGQVHGVTAQDDGILDGDHVVAVVGAAGLAEDLHGDQLGIGGNTLDIDVFQRLGEGAVVIGDIGVGGGDTGDMGAVGALGIVIVDDIGVLVDVVVSKSDLAVDIQALGGVCGTDMELIQLGGDLLGIQQVQTGHVGSSVHALLGGVHAQGVLKGGCGHGLVVGVDTGIDDGDPAACAGIAVGPGDVGADLVAGGGHVGIDSLVLIHNGRLIPGLQEDLLDARDGLDLVDQTILHIGGDDVGNQSQVPDNVKLAADGSLDAGGHGFLLRLQAAAVGHGLGICGNVLGGEALVNGGLLLQNNGDTDGVRIRIQRLFLRIGSLVQKLQGRAVLQLGKSQRLAVLSCVGVSSGLGRHGIAGQQGHDQQQRKQADGEILFHNRTPLFLLHNPHCAWTTTYHIWYGLSIAQNAAFFAHPFKSCVNFGIIFAFIKIIAYILRNSCIYESCPIR